MDYIGPLVPLREFTVCNFVKKLSWPSLYYTTVGTSFNEVLIK